MKCVRYINMLNTLTDSITSYLPPSVYAVLYMYLLLLLIQQLLLLILLLRLIQLTNGLELQLSLPEGEHAALMVMRTSIQQTSLVLNQGFSMIIYANMAATFTKLLLIIIGDINGTRHWLLLPRVLEQKVWVLGVGIYVVLISSLIVMEAILESIEMPLLSRMFCLNYLLKKLMRFFKFKGVNCFLENHTKKFIQDLVSGYDDMTYSSLDSKIHTEDELQKQIGLWQLNNLEMGQSAYLDSNRSHAIGLINDRGNKTLGEIAAERGYLLPVVCLLSAFEKRCAKVWVPLYTNDRISQGSLLHSALSSENLLLVLFVANIFQAYNCLYPACITPSEEPILHRIISKGVGFDDRFCHFEFDDTHANRKMVAAAKTLNRHKDPYSKSRLLISYVLKLAHIKTDQVDLVCNDEIFSGCNSNNADRSASVNRFLKIVYHSRGFCSDRIKSPANLIGHITKTFTKQQRTEVFLTRSSETGRTALHHAVQKADLETVHYILKAVKHQYKVIGSVDSAGETILHMIAGLSVELVKQILKPLKPDERLKLLLKMNTNRQTALHKAAKVGSVELIRTLVKCVPKESAIQLLREKDSDGRTVPMVAVWHRKDNATEITELMLGIISERDRLLLLKLQDNCGNTLLHHFMKFGIDQSSFSSAFESLPPIQKLRLMDIRNNIGSSPLDECRTQNGLQNQVRESSQWLLRHYSKLRTAAILDESDKRKRRELLKDFVQNGKGVHFDDLEALSKDSNFYVIPHNQSLSKAYLLIYFTKKRRDGADEEVETLKTAFKRFGMTVYVRQWNNSEDLLEDYSEKLKEVANDCCFLIVSIMAHGYKGHVVGDDGSPRKLSDLINMVKLELKDDIPVAFIIQACQEKRKGGCSITLTRPHTVLLLSTVAHGTAVRGAFIRALSDQVRQLPVGEEIEMTTLHAEAVKTMQGEQVPVMITSLKKDLTLKVMGENPP